MRIEVGDRVRVDIPDTTDMDYHLHGNHGDVIEIIQDDGGSVTGRDRDSNLYRIQMDKTGEIIDLRGVDLRPPLDE